MVFNDVDSTAVVILCEIRFEDKYELQSCKDLKRGKCGLFEDTRGTRY
jgi:hypothetical protein